MREIHKLILQALIDGGTIVAYRDGSYRLRDSQCNPLRKFQFSTFLHIRVYLRKKNGIWYLDKNVVRSMHGKTWLKQQYKLTLKNKQNEKVDDTADAAGSGNNDKL